MNFDLNIFQWVVLAISTIGTIGSILLINKPMKSFTHVDAVIGIVFYFVVLCALGVIK